MDYLISENTLFSYPLTNEKFYLALKEGRDELAKTLINKNANVNLHGKEPSPFYWAINNGCLDSADLMLEKNVLLNAEYERKTPLVSAIYKYVHEKNPSKKTKYKELIHLMIEKGADLNPQIEEINLPLCLTIEFGDFELLDYFIRKGSIINYAKNDKQHSVALAQAVVLNSEEAIIRLLKEGAVLEPQAIKKYSKTNQNSLQKIMMFANNFQQAKEFFTKYSSNAEVFLNNAYAEEEVYFKVLMLEWATHLDFQHRKILADSPTVKNAFGFELLHLLFYKPNENLDLPSLLDKTHEINFEKEDLPSPLLIMLKRGEVDNARAMIEKSFI